MSFKVKLNFNVNYFVKNISLKINVEQWIAVILFQKYQMNLRMIDNKFELYFL